MAKETTRRRRPEAGQAMPLVIGMVAVAAVLILALAWFAASLVDAAAARTAADAAALAGVADRSDAQAAAAARANGAELVSARWSGDDLTVTVRVGRAVASARATIRGAPFPTLGDRDRSSG